MSTPTPAGRRTGSPGRRRWTATRWWRDGERGSGSMVALLVGVAVLALLAAGVTAGQTWRAASRARTAADLAALAGSGATSPTALLPVPPCVAAAEVATRNGAQLVGCRVKDFDVTVVVRVDSGTPFGAATVTATAGPRPQDGPRKRRGRPPAPSPPPLPPTPPRGR
ncbi:hypothetical protein CYJ76_03905 [Kytococcus schroeteri]|uniref:Uncharacterized protein n=2 Tax=Kytococcus schroeteri TaxID=138300 RepID=A0A2I1PC46_9MICO|nr:Rv3654c family TadE-like protein [Kytococcus schroeteri]PKZ42197.1 hypothetical protein CYJ76_03905 [Kytococcus schroeteri]